MYYWKGVDEKLFWIWKIQPKKGLGENEFKPKIKEGVEIYW